MARQLNDDQHADVSFARSLGLFDATMLGLGVMLGAGIFVLIGLACGVAGPAAVLVFAGNALVSLFTCLSYMELVSAIPEAGGGYSFIRRAFPLPVGFLAGWGLWFALIISSALFALGFGHFLHEMLHSYAPLAVEAIDARFAFWPDAPSLLFSLIVIAIFAALNYKGAEVTGKAENWLTLGKLATVIAFLYFGARFALAHPEAALASFAPLFPNGGGAVFAAMALTFIAFGGYDLICSIAEEVHEPERTIPRAIFISWLVAGIGRVAVVFIALAAIPVIDGQTSWQYLGAHGKIGLLAASGAFLGPFWSGVVAFGGLLATTGALNACVLAASRVAFSMSRDGMQWQALSRVHRRNRTPHVAILVTTALIIVIALLLDLETIGSASSLMFLVIFTLVNLSLLALRRDRLLQRRFSVPFFPITPLLGALSCILLICGQLLLGSSGIVSIVVSLTWLLFGCVLFMLSFRKTAEKSVPQVIRPFPEYVRTLRSVRFRVMAYVYHPDSVETLARIACKCALGHGNDTEVVIAYVIKVPVQMDVREGLRDVPQAEATLHPVYSIARELSVELRTEIRIAHDVPEAIAELAKHERVNLLLIGWRGSSSRRESILGGVVDEVLDNAPCDVMVVRTRPAFTPRFAQILLPTAGGPSARLAARVASTLLEPDGRLTVLGVAVGALEDEERLRARDSVAQTLAEVPAEVNVRRELASAKRGLSRSVAVSRAILKQSKQGYDLIMVGASHAPWFKRVLVGEIPENVAKRSSVPVAIVKQHEGARTWLQRMLGG